MYFGRNKIKDILEFLTLPALQTNSCNTQGFMSEWQCISQIAVHMETGFGMV